MFILGDILVAVSKVLNIVLTFLWIVILARAILSWVNPDPYNPIVQFIHNVTEPILYQVRKRLPFQFGGIDISPVIVFLAIILIKEIIIHRLYVLGASIR